MQREAAEEFSMDNQYPLEALVGLKAQAHRPDEARGGCSCGFCAWSPEHVAIMAYREASDMHFREIIVHLDLDAEGFERGMRSVDNA